MDIKSSYVSTLSQNKKRQIEIKQKHTKDQYNSVQKWLRKIFCLPYPTIQSPTKLEISSQDSIYQPTIRVFKPQLCDFNELLKSFGREPYKVLSSTLNDDSMGFVGSVQQLKYGTQQEMYQKLIHTHDDHIVLLLAQTPNMQLIEYLQNKVLQLVIQLPCKQKANTLLNHLELQYEKGIKKTKIDHQIPEIIFGKIIRKQVNIFSQIIIMADYCPEGKQYLIEWTQQLLDLIPNKIHKLVFIFPPQITYKNIELLGSLINTSFFYRFENYEWMQRLKQIQLNRNIVQLFNKESKKSAMLGSQFVSLNKYSKQNYPFKIQFDNMELILQILGFTIDNIEESSDQVQYVAMKAKFHVKKHFQGDVDVYQSIIQDVQPQTSQITRLNDYFTRKIFFVDKLTTLSQYDKREIEYFVNLINQASFMSCCLCVQLIKEDNICFESFLNENQYKLFIQILVGSGILFQEQDCIEIQTIYKRYLPQLQIYQAFIANNQINQSELTQPQFQVFQDDRPQSFDYYPFSEDENNYMGSSEMIQATDLGYMNKFRKSQNQLNYPSSFYNAYSPSDIRMEYQ